MKHKIFLIALLFIAISFSNKLYSIELDTVWKSNKIGFNYFFQHPTTNNIVMNFRSSNGLVELDSKTGELIRNVGFSSSYVDLSPDGSMLVSSGIDLTQIYDYDNLEIIQKIESSNLAKFIGNDRVIYRIAQNSTSTSKIGIYNIKTKETKIINTTSITAIGVSPDGKYVAFGVREKADGLPGDIAKLVLCDGETLSVIKELDKWVNTGHEIIEIRFSDDSKYLTFQGRSSSQIPTSIFEITSLKKIIEFKPLIIGDISYIHFLDDKYLLRVHFNNENKKRYATLINYKNLLVVDILNLNLHKWIIYNQGENCIYAGIIGEKQDGSEDYTAKYQLKNILSNNINSEPQKICIYENNILTVFESNLLSLELTDLSGRIILQKTFNTSQQNQIEIPLELNNGTYLVKLQTKETVITHKLLVME